MRGHTGLRVVVVDDEPLYRADFQRILGGRQAAGPAEASLESLLFGAGGLETGLAPVEVTAFEAGSGAVEAVRAARTQGAPFAVAFVALPLAGGLDGVATASALRALDSDLHIVLVTAEPDLPLVEITEQVPPVDKLFLIGKPLMALCVQQLVAALGARWRAERSFLDAAGRPAGYRDGGVAQMFRQIPAGLLLFDERDRLVSANGTVGTLLPELAEFLQPGVRYEEIQRRTAEELLPEDTLVRVDAWVADRMAWHAKSGGVVEQRLKGGRIVVVAEGEDTRGGTCCLYLDVTDLKQREANRWSVSHMSQIAQSFSALYDEIAPLLAQARSDEATGAPLATPAGRGGGSERITFLPLGGVRPKRKGGVGDLAERLQAIAQRQDLTPTTVGLNPLIGEVVRRQRGSLPSGIDIEVVAGAGLWAVLLDGEALSEALAELMANASEAMNGMGRVTLETGNVRVDRDYAARHPGLTPGEYVRIAITDRGPGMSNDMAERALNPFFTSKGGEGHLGLGLSAVYGFTNQSGGTLVVNGGRGEGATVELYFPRTEEEVAPIDQDAERRREAPPQRRAGKGQ